MALLELDARFSEFHLSGRARSNARSVIGLLCVAGLFVAVLGFGGRISHEWQSFTQKDAPVSGNDVRNRLDSFRIGGRVPGWHIAIQVFDHNSLHGHGAGTFAIDWDRSRPNTGTALETHSLYLEAMSELGVVGLASVVAALLLAIGACFARSRRASRSMWIAIGVAGLVWAVHAGVDWDWEMPAVTLPVIALMAGGLGHRGGRKRLRPPVETVLRVAVGLIAVAVAITGLRISSSDRHLVSGVAAFNQGNCPAAVADARASISALGSRPQPYAIVGYCDVDARAPKQAVALMHEALSRDPQNWRYLYGLAVAEAAEGVDPQPALAKAAALDPLEPMIAAARTSFRGRNPRSWERAALTVEMPVSTRE